MESVKYNKSKTEAKMRFIYVMDPMCSWCYGFQPELEEFLEKYPSIELEWVMGGLAPDNSNPMDENMKQSISSYWYEIEKKSQVTFNHDFWKVNTPFRSTYPACRAVIAAELLKEKSSQLMVKAIQSAYYQEAKNPSLEETLIACASSIGLEESQFSQVLNSEETEHGLQKHLRIAQQLQARSFPTLFYINEENQAYLVAPGFCKAANLETQFKNIKGT